MFHDLLCMPFLIFIGWILFIYFFIIHSNMSASFLKENVVGIIINPIFLSNFIGSEVFVSFLFFLCPLVIRKQNTSTISCSLFFVNKREHDAYAFIICLCSQEDKLRKSLHISYRPQMQSLFDSLSCIFCSYSRQYLNI